MSTKGLEGVVAAETSLSKVYGLEGRLIYRGYEIEDLAANTSFEEVCHLLWYGELPTRAQLDELKGRFVEEAELPGEVLDLVRRMPQSAHPMSVLRTAVSALGCYDPEAEDMAREANLRKAIRITARMLTLTGTMIRLRAGGEPLEPRADLSLAANLLYLIRGKEPDALTERAMDAALILHAEHGMNASTFSARVTIATFSDIYSAVTSAIGTLKGPLHGGANEGVMRMLQEIGDPAVAADWVRKALDEKRRIMGFGHRVYKTLDPRAPILRSLAEQLAQQGGDTRWLDIAAVVQQTMAEEMERRQKQIYPNVDFYSAPLYFTMGIPTNFFTNIFACARTPGWTAHIIEQLDDNRLIRPSSDYVGPHGRKVVPIDQRG